jgi:hypothetical protein
MVWIVNNSLLVEKRQNLVPQWLQIPEIVDMPPG